MKAFQYMTAFFTFLFVSFNTWADGIAPAVSGDSKNMFQNLLATHAGKIVVQFGPFVLLALVFYFIIIRPGQKRTKAQRELLSSLKAGDEVVTSSGITGKIEELNDSTALIVTDEKSGTKLRFQRQNISQILPQGTLSS